MDAVEVSPILESLLFVSENPVRLETLLELLPEWDRDAILGAVQKIREECSRDERGVELVEVAGGFQYRTKPRWAEWVNRLKKSKPFKLSQSALETLAIVAYRQPVIRPEIEQVRGVDSGWVLRSLMERGLIRMMGRKDIPGKPIIYGTTKAFLELFGLKALSDLPTLKEVQAPENLEEAQRAAVKRALVKKEITSPDESEISEVLEAIEKDENQEESGKGTGGPGGTRYREALEGLQKSEPGETHSNETEPVSIPENSPDLVQEEQQGGEDNGEKKE
jgi:segregation and condensation protein B